MWQLRKPIENFEQRTVLIQPPAPAHTLFLSFTYHEVRGGEETVLVGVHDAEGLLELLDGGVGEGVEDVGLLGHLEAGDQRRMEI
jgi:hypothetical protein